MNSNPFILKVAVGDLPGDQEFAYFTYLIMAIIISFTFLVLLYITVKVIQKVGASDKVIPLMLVFLQLCALCNVAFLAYQCINIRRNPEVTENLCFTTMLSNGSSMFLTLAVLMNINKWVYFTLRIQSHINVRQREIIDLVNEEED